MRQRYEITKYLQSNNSIISVQYKEFETEAYATSWCAMNSSEVYAFMHECKPEVPDGPEAA